MCLYTVYKNIILRTFLYNIFSLIKYNFDKNKAR